MTTSTIPNGRQRKSLAEQIDRLDGILDGLADGLNEAVVGAVKEAVTLAVRQAVQAVMTEVLTNKDLVGLLRGPLTQAAAATAPEPAVSRPAGVLSRVGAWAGRMWGKARRAVSAVLGLTGRGLVAGWQLVRRFRGQVLLAVGVGAAAGVAVYFAGPWLAAGAAWVAGFATTLAVQAGMALRRALAALSFQSA